MVPKPHDPESIGICLDMRCPNTAIKREKHVSPTIDDFIESLSVATLFSKLDLTAAFHQIELAESSRYITTFATHIGLKRYKRVNFGINSTGEIFGLLISQTNNHDIITMLDSNM